MYSPSLRSWDSVLSVAVVVVTLFDGLRCVACPRRLWRHLVARRSMVLEWQWPCKWCFHMFTARRHWLLKSSRAPSCGTSPAGDTSPSDSGCSRGLPHSEVPDSDSPPDRASSCLTEKRSHPASGPANTESWVRRFNPWAPMEWPRGSP